MGGILEVIKNRRSIRKYKPIPVEIEKVISILEAGRWAPSSGNIQNWKFIVVFDRKKIEDIAKACLQPWITEAPVLIVVCGEPEKAKRYGAFAEMYTIQNTAAAIENMLLQAYSIGLGSCWIGYFNEKKIKEILEIPENVRIYGIITLGYPDEEPKSDRKGLEEIVFFDKWGNKQIPTLKSLSEFLDKAKDMLKFYTEIIKKKLRS